MGIRSGGRRGFLKTMAGGVASMVALESLFPNRLLLAKQLESLPQKSFESLKTEYGLAPDIHYFNHASVGTMSKAVQEAYFGYVRICETNPWLHIWNDAWVAAHHQTRQTAAAMMGCEANEVCLNHNTTEGFNLLAAGLPLKPGDEVLFSSLNHVGASACWFHQAETKGFSVRRFPFPVANVAGMSRDDLVDIHLREITPKTKVLVLPHIDNFLGIRHPVKEIALKARERGVPMVAVDGAQSVGMIPLNVSKLGVDFYMTSAHKWVQAPKGRGFMYIARNWQDRLRPMMVTWGQDRWQEDARKYEDFGTRDLPAILAMGDAMAFQNQLGEAPKENHYKALHQLAKTRVEANPNWEWHSPKSWELGASLFAIGLKGVSSKAVFDKLYPKFGYVFRAFSSHGLQTIRIAPNTLNTRDELNLFFDRLEREFA